MKVTPLGISLSPLCEFSQSLKSTMYQFEVGDGYCGQAIGRPEKVGFSFTAVMTEAHAQRLKLCWDEHDALVVAVIAKQEFQRIDVLSLLCAARQALSKLTGTYWGDELETALAPFAAQTEALKEVKP